MTDKADCASPSPRISRGTRLWGFLARNASVVISTCSLVTSIASLCVALIAFQYSTASQQRDFAYKELTIRPKLMFLSSTDFSWKLRNAGLGPAVIKKWSLLIGERCVTTEKFNLPVMEEFVRHIWGTLFYNVFGSLHPSLPSRPMNYIVGALQHGSYIDRGEEFPLFRLSSEQVNDIQQRFGAMTEEDKQAMMRKYYNAVFSIPISVTYCSVSELFCETIGTIGLAERCAQSQ